MNYLKQKFIWIILVVGILILILIFQKDLYSKLKSADNTPQTVESVKQELPKDAEPQIISTKPDPLENAIISATEEVEITFNRPLENVGEFKVRIDPKIDYKVELSANRKTARIVPVKPYQLGTTYTLFIGPDTKFDGVGSWGKDKTFHFRTITYRGV